MEIHKIVDGEMVFEEVFSPRDEINPKDEGYVVNPKTIDDLKRMKPIDIMTPEAQEYLVRLYEME